MLRRFEKIRTELDALYQTWPEEQASQHPYRRTHMPRLKKILLPVDYSDCSRVAMEYALFLAERFDAEIEVLHIAEGFPLGEEHTVAESRTPGRRSSSPS